jgi:protein-L-isoaspartate O-methyltransferase
LISNLFHKFKLLFRPFFAKKWVKWRIYRLITRLCRLIGLGSFPLLQKDMGHFKSSLNWVCNDGKGEPIPWFTYPAIAFIQQLDLRQKLIFEYGSGSSSAFFAARCQQIVSVEDDLDWAEKIRHQQLKNHTLLFKQGTETYAQSISEAPHSIFDVIVVDGSHRLECAQKAVAHLAENGILILDNADWYAHVAAFLRAQNLIQVDFHGFGPINQYTWTTSIFFTRNYHFEPLNGVQPQTPLGGLEQIGL